MQALMSRDAGVVRNGEGLREALREIDSFESDGDSRRWQEARNIRQTAWLILKSALARKESRGAHYRTDFPAHDDAAFRKHSLIKREEIWFE